MSLKRQASFTSDTPCDSKKRSVYISYKELEVLCASTRHVPERTTKRWDLISKIVSSAASSSENNSPKLLLNEKHGVKSKSFDKTPSGCKEVVSLLHSKYSETLDSSEDAIQHTILSSTNKSALKPIVLLPPVKRCCDEPILIRNRPSFPLVYTTKGTYIAALFSGECVKGCGKKFSHSYYHDNGKLYYFNPDDSEYFHITTQTVFSSMLLADITNNISISAASFLSRAEVYNEDFRQVDSERLKNYNEFGRSASDKDHPWKLTEKRVEDAWFVFSLVSFYKQRGVLSSIDFHTDPSCSQRSDLDLLCSRTWDIILQDTNPWIHHKCKIKGCIEGKASLFVENLD